MKMRKRHKKALIRKKIRSKLVVFKSSTYTWNLPWYKSQWDFSIFCGLLCEDSFLHDTIFLCKCFALFSFFFVCCPSFNEAVNLLIAWKYTQSTAFFHPTQVLLSLSHVGVNLIHSLLNSIQLLCKSHPDLPLVRMISQSKDFWVDCSIERKSKRWTSFGVKLFF